MTWQSSPTSTEVGRAGPGTVIGGRYALRAAVGHGGMGTVWRAADTQLGRDVAVKEVVPPPGIAPEDRDAMHERLLREARAAAMISHPGVVQVYDVVTDGNRPWIVMELLDARSLADMVLEDGPLAPRAVAKVGVTLLGALEMAHAAGVLHRDVKPANVLVCADGRCVLTDFGVARMPTDQQLTTPGMVLGSPHFISPERALGASFGPPSDLFSLGVTLYCAVEGRPPFDKGEPIATMHSVVEDDPRPPELAGPLTEVLYGLLEKDPQQRWDSATAREALRDLLAGPLASRSTHFPTTDPYAVVPAQRQPWQTSPAPPPAGPGRSVGGRAMLAPGESPTDRVTQADPYESLPDSYAHDTYERDRYDAGTYEPGTYGRGAPGPAASPRQPAPPAGPTGRRRLPAVPLSRRSVLTAVAAGLAVLLVVGTVWAFARGGDDPVGPAAGGQPSPGVASPAPEPAFPVQEFADRGLVVNLPAAWVEQDRSEIRVDFVDPDDSIARIRLLTESSGRDARGFVEGIAEPNIERNCPEPYQRVDLVDIEVDGHPAALLEYTCGSGDEAQRTRWVTTVRDGTAYSFFLRLREAEFEAGSAIFDELVGSFRVTGS